MGEIVEGIHGLIGLAHLAPELVRFVRTNPGLSAILAALVVAGCGGAILIARSRPVSPPSIR